MKLLAISLLPLVWGKDPAEGWLGYATGTNPNQDDTPITFIEAYWKNCDNPKTEGAFFSPWFGIETSDNLNLIQPVNPWTGNGWQIYNEYFQWKPVHNENSDSYKSSPGDILYGSVTLNEKDHSYTILHKDLTNGASVTTTIPIQKKNFGGDYKTYNIVYFVFEKEAECSQYPPDGEVTFYNITVEYGGKKVSPDWTTAYVDDVCNNRAHIIDEDTIKISWDTSMDNGEKQAAITGLHDEQMQILGQCKKSSYSYCCEIGTPCDCTKGVSTPGQCKEGAYAYCCSFLTPCDCTQPPLARNFTHE